jgi:hypothetical protein
MAFLARGRAVFCYWSVATPVFGFVSAMKNCTTEAIPDALKAPSTIAAPLDSVPSCPLNPLTVYGHTVPLTGPPLRSYCVTVRNVASPAPLNERVPTVTFWKV